MRLQKPKKLGLKGDGHGGWYNKQGEFVAKTEGGELVFYGKDNKPGEKDEPHPSTPTGQNCRLEQKQVRNHK